ncbi:MULTISPECIES: murein hydrolase activator EnvC [Thalassospira]|uniref:Peptidase M23 n=1 Tax=Thalassospira profundimaris TaxID=502049 RepID=A0A367VB23_9PROT|nr:MULTISPECIES: peptidoglycan DD-metalloendopeptidase family protein [Thalassospira]KZB72045.1 peptidase M23 [Thalassospira sp. MCCC 1A01148]MBR9901268.1 peptidoglycan DD-metalloendopeptidase family protein [Rhodospirillales bacterium]RCK22189.1 peptidase M23 [Thalassospira profundimaris]
MTRFLRAKLAYEIALPALIAFAVLAAGGAAPSFAQSLQKVDQQLDQLENQLSEQQKQEEFLSRKSRELWTEEQALQSEAISVARRAQRLETTLTDLEDQLENLEAREKVAATSLEDKAGQYARILMALQRLSTTPPEAVIALPTSPQDTLRSAVLLKAALPGVEQHARDLRKELGEIATLREDIRNRRSELAAATQELQNERASLSALLDEKRRLRAQTEAEAEEAAEAVSALADEAKSLGELLRNLQNRAEGLPVPRSRPDMRVAARTEPDADTLGATTIAKNTPPPPPESKTEPASSNDSGTNDTSDEEEFAVGSSITLAQGNLRMPASGKVVTLFGEKSRGPDGLTVNRSKGIEISTRANAQVVSPFDGKVVFAGPFRGYGRLLIIEHGEGYHSLIAGFDRLDSVVGQYLLAGEPVGIMGETSPKLYLEMRQNGEAINPLPWLASKNGKVSG